jgi:hypothetical protein
VPVGSRAEQPAFLRGEIMVRKRLRAVAVLCAVAVAIGVTAAAPSGAAVPSQQKGVDNDAIQVVVIVPDLDTLRSKGINVGSGTNQGFADRFKALADAYGKINGRTVEVTPVAWDPLDATSFEKACTAATIDNQPFVVINGAGYRDSSFPCITVDNDTPFMTGDPATKEVMKASGNNLVTLSLPPDVGAKNAVRLLEENDRLPKSAKIGILSNNIPAPKAAGDALEKELTKRGYDVVEKIDLNGLASDAAILRTGAEQAVVTFQAAGADTVFNVQSLTQVQAMYAEIEKTGAQFDVFSVDGQANTCVPNAAIRAPASLEGMTCVTIWDTKATADKDGTKPDNKIEAQCREDYDAGTGKTTRPGGPSSGVTVNGVFYEEDISPMECTIANLLLPAIEKAGKNVTWDKVYKNMMAVKSGPSAFMSGGTGSFGKNKPYWADQMHFMVFAPAGADTPETDGLWNGCPVPANCFVPELIDGQEWFPIKQ